MHCLITLKSTHLYFDANDFVLNEIARIINKLFMMNMHTFKNIQRCVKRDQLKIKYKS